MPPSLNTTLLAIAAALFALPASVESVNLGAPVQKALAKRLAGSSAKKDWQAVAHKDAQNHLKPAKELPKERIVERYTSQAQASRELRYGLGQEAHMTTGVHRGHPYSGERAKNRYGIEPSKSIEVKETIRIPAGHPVRHNRVPGGERGVGEITSPTPLPKENIIKITPMRGRDGD